MMKKLIKMKNYFKKKLKIRKLRHAIKKLIYVFLNIFYVRQQEKKLKPIAINGGWKNPYKPDLSSKPNEPTIPMNPKIYKNKNK